MGEEGVGSCVVEGKTDEDEEGGVGHGVEMGEGEGGEAVRAG